MTEAGIDLSHLLETTSTSELLDEGIISAIKGAILSWFISMCSEKMLNTAINKSFTKAMGKLKTPEEKEKAIALRQELLALDKKEKKARLKALIKKAPEKDIAAAELKARSIIKSQNKKVQVQEETIISAEEYGETKRALGFAQGQNVMLRWAAALLGIIIAILSIALVVSIATKMEDTW